MHAAGHLLEAQVEQEQVGVDAVALRQVHPEAEPARFLGAHHRAVLDHERADELVADRALDDLDAVVLAESRRHRRVVDRHDHRLAQAAVLGQVVHEQARDLELVDEVALLVGRAGAIRVAIEQQPELVPAAHDLASAPRRCSAGSARGSRRRSTGCAPGGSRGRGCAHRRGAAMSQPAPAPHIGSTRTSMSAVLERVEVDRSTDVPLVALERVVALDAARPPRRRRRAGARRARPRRSTASMTASMSGPPAEPVGALTLKPLSVHGLWLAVMTMPADGAALDDLVGAHLGRHGVRRERDRDVVGEDHLGRGHREVLRGEAPVVGDDDALRLLALARPRSGPRRRRSGGRSRTCSPRRCALASRRSRRRSATSPLGSFGSGHWRSSHSATRVNERVDGSRVRGRADEERDGALRRGYRAAPPLTARRPPMAFDDEVRLGGVRRLVRRDHPTRARAADAAMSCVHEPEVAPADVHRAHRDALVARGALHDGTVDRHRLQPVVRRLQARLAAADTLPIIVIRPV